MNIAMVTDAYNFGRGGDVATIRLAEGLKKRGHVITVVSTQSVQKERFFKVKGFCPPNAKESFEKMDFLFGIPEKDVLRKAFADVDLVQIQHPFYLDYGAAKIAKAMGKPVVAAFHCQPQNILGTMGLEGPFKEFLVAKLFNFLLFNRAPIVQCPSQFAADYLKKSGCRSALRVISNGIPPEYVVREQARPEWFGDNMVLVSVGRHAPEKRPGLIIQGLKRCKHADKIQLLLCGKGEHTEELKALGADLPVKPFVQYVTQEEKLTYLNTADLFVHASIVELESLSSLEAIGCGLPCLISDSRHSAASQFALDERFLFKSDDAENLAAKIDYWYEHRDQLKGIRNSVLAMAEKYRFEHCLDQMEALYDEVLHAKGRAS